MLYTLMSRCCSTIHGKARLLTKISRASVSSSNEEHYKRDIISRTKVIVDEKECNSICQAILQDKRAIGVDMEGVTLSRLGLLQMRTEDGNIYLIRS
jgi:hypothetical protein